MKMNNYEITVFGIDYKLRAREYNSSNLMFYLEDNPKLKFPNFYKYHAGKLIMDIKMPNGTNQRALLTRSTLNMFMTNFI